jgi:sarcosine oxidase/L-pipecolate oxidase
LIISCLDPQKESGTHAINHRMVIAREHYICRPLCKLFNLSLRKILFPSFWKLANVTAVFKKSDKSITSNYRPISLFCCVSRIFERTVFKYVLTISVDIIIYINFSLAFSLDIPLHMFNSNSAIVLLYHGDNKLIINEMMTRAV